MEDVKEAVPSGLSVVVFVGQEAVSTQSLVERLRQVIVDYGPFEILIAGSELVSLNKYVESIRTWDSKCPVTVIDKQTGESKALSIRRGLATARYSVLAVVDTDINHQCGLEQLGQMYNEINSEIVDVAVIERWWRPRRNYHSHISWLYRYLIVLPLFLLPYDTRSGLIMFRREYISAASLYNGNHSFGLVFLWHAKNMGAKIKSVPVVFYKRNKRNWIKRIYSGWSIIIETILIRTSGFGAALFEDNSQPNQAGNGIKHRGKSIITHSSLPIDKSAFKRLNRWQVVVSLCLILLLVLALLVDWQKVFLWGVIVMSVIYLLDLFLMFFVVLSSLTKSSEITFARKHIEELDEENLPVYTILCPLYKEAEIIDQFIGAMLNIDWPAEKLDVQLLIEEDDEITQRKLAGIQLPEQFTVQIVPDGEPKTKPKACNYGLAYARGEYVVIFDAEDIPEPDQLKKAYIAFRQAGSEVVCLQAKLDYYNAKQNLLTRLFAVEYNLWFGVVLPSLYALRAPIPLGGTSNHFRRQALDSLLGWDPFNVTEDCDLGIRLFSRGWRTGIIDSYTHEEANSQLGNWIRQRSRWIKGYLQTQLVASRNIHVIAKQGWSQLVIFILVFGHRSWSVFINPLLWILTIGYFVQPHFFKPITELLFSGPIVYVSGFTMIIGNFLYFYANMLGALKTGQWWMVKYAFIIPFYWLLMSVAGCHGFWQLITKPHYWEKTKHGLHVASSEQEAVIARKAAEFG